MFDRSRRSVVAWLAACSLLVSSTAAIVHTHEHTGHEHANCAVRSKPVETCAKCRQQHQVQPVSQSEQPHQHPAGPHSHDDCSLCQFLLEHPLPPSFVELPMLEMVLEFRLETPRFVVVSARFDLPPARGPPCLA